MQTNWLLWFGINSKCEFEGPKVKYINDVPGFFKRGDDIKDHLQLHTPGDYCFVVELVTKHQGIWYKEGFYPAGIRNNKKSYDYLNAHIRGPYGDLSSIYVYINTDNCKCCSIAQDLHIRREYYSLSYVGAWSGTF